VRVPKKDLLGERNRGWYVATTTLDFERSGIISGASLQMLVRQIAA
jgi:alkylation response protein AidB-like acyl-CoA dehydrogenase